MLLLSGISFTSLKSLTFAMSMNLFCKNPVWSYVVEKCPSFSAKDCNAQFSEIFKENVFSCLIDAEKVLFLTKCDYSALCPILQYISCISISENWSRSWSTAIRNASFFVQQVDCRACSKKCSITESMISSATILFIQFSPIFINTVIIYEQISISGMQ